jgi:hypothetical protein
MIDMPPDIANRGIGMNLKVRPRSIQSKTTNSTGLLISGCQSHQTSADAWIHTKYMGAATYYLSEVLHDYDYDIDYKTLVEKMNKRLSRWGYSQRPELNGDPTIFSTKFLSSK